MWPINSASKEELRKRFLNIIFSFYGNDIVSVLSCMHLEISEP